MGLGGKKNIVDVDCCATRLRVTVAEPERVSDDLLKQTDSRGIVKKGQGALRMPARELRERIMNTNREITELISKK